jgi:hypothetical protein
MHSLIKNNPKSVLGIAANDGLLFDFYNFFNVHNSAAVSSKKTLAFVLDGERIFLQYIDNQQVALLLMY